jgi:hypothetical protein
LPKEDIQETSRGESAPEVEIPAIETPVIETPVIEGPVATSHGINAQRTSRPRSEWEQLVSNRKVILAMLFFVTGALGLPLLWLSPAFNATEKVIWSLVTLVYTLMLIGLCVAICYWAYSQVMLSI